jgi:hypothetical protein
VVTATSVFTSTVLPAAIGAVLAAAGCLIALLRTNAFSQMQASRVTVEHRRRLSIRIVVGLYAAIAYICLIVAIAIGDPAFMVLTAIIALLASAMVLRLWSGR